MKEMEKRRREKGGWEKEERIRMEARRGIEKGEGGRKKVEWRMEKSGRDKGKRRREMGEGRKGEGGKKRRARGGMQLGA